MGTRTRGFANNISSPSGVFDATDLNGVVPATNLANSSLTNVTDVSSSLGFSITSVASDPPAPSEGQMWYNTTSNTLKGYLFFASNSWASGGNLNNAVYGNAMSGTQTAALSFGGNRYPPVTAGTEAYNGSSWTAVNAMNTARQYLAGCGTQTAALAFGGFPPATVATNATEKWDGTSWTSNPTGLNTSRGNLSGVGIQTAGLAIGGDLLPTTPRTSGAVESWNGTSWTTTTSLNTTRRNTGAAGTNTATIVFGGFTDSPNSVRTESESWNGSSWTNTASLPQARWNMGSAGTQTAALGFGGSSSPSGNPPNNSTIDWDGSVWSTLPATLTTNRQRMSGTGTYPAALGAGGYVTPGVTAATEEWTGTALATRTITGS